MTDKFIVFFLLVACAGTAWAGAPNMSVADYLSAKKRISADSQAEQSFCNTGAGTNRELCMARAMGRDRIAKADLEVAYRSTPRSRFDASEARAEARFWLARERCDAIETKDRITCLQGAKDILLDARADGTALMNAAELEGAVDNTCAYEKSAGQPATRTCMRRTAEVRSRLGRGAK